MTATANADVSTEGNAIPTRRITGRRIVALTITLLVLSCLVGNTIVDLSVGNLANIPFLLVLLSAVAVGWLLAWKRPRNPLGWMLLAVPGLFSLMIPLTALAMALHPVAPDAAAWIYWYAGDRDDTWAWLPPVALLFTQIPLRFPDGRLPTPRWRWFSWFTIISVVVSSAILSTFSVDVAPGVPSPAHVAWDETTLAVLTMIVFGGLLAPSFVGSIASLFVRYRRAGSVERAQLRWVFLAGCIPVALLLVTWSELFTTILTPVQNVIVVSYAFIPIAIAIAVLRYGLYAIDRIISRTASWAIVTVVIVGAYALVVLSIGRLLPDLPALGVALATLAAAVVFLPFLRWVQRIVDRRFDRAHYDAARVVDEYGEGLRNGADPHTASADLLIAVNRSLQPSTVGMWTRPEESA